MTLPDKPKDAGADAAAKAKPAPSAAEAAAKGSAEEEPKPVWEKKVTPDTALLFRYSALTFNT